MGSDEHGLMVEQSARDPLLIDPKRNRYPYCIVWTPLPVLSWFFPCIGHVGICREDGVILDFAGPNFVCVDNFTFGSPVRYIQLGKEQCCIFPNSCDLDNEDGLGCRSNAPTWDDALNKSTQEYQHQSYNLFTCNCHSFVANCLNRLKFHGGGWNVVNLAVLVFIKGKWVNKLSVLRTYLPFILVISLGLGFGGVTFFTYLAIFIVVLLSWFVIGTYFFKKVIYL